MQGKKSYNSSNLDQRQNPVDNKPNKEESVFVRARFFHCFSSFCLIVYIIFLISETVKR